VSLQLKEGEETGQNQSGPVSSLTPNEDQQWREPRLNPEIFQAWAAPSRFGESDMLSGKIIETIEKDDINLAEQADHPALHATEDPYTLPRYTTDIDISLKDFKPEDVKESPFLKPIKPTLEPTPSPELTPRPALGDARIYP
jgi:hypothetical protein